MKLWILSNHYCANKAIECFIWLITERPAGHWDLWFFPFSMKERLLWPKWRNITNTFTPHLKRIQSLEIKRMKLKIVKWYALMSQRASSWFTTKEEFYFAERALSISPISMAILLKFRTMDWSISLNTVVKIRQYISLNSLWMASTLSRPLISRKQSSIMLILLSKNRKTTHLILKLKET